MPGSEDLRIVAPFARGGATDLITRIYADALAKRLGVEITIDNEPGEGGTRGAAIVARAKPDGHTLVMGTSSTHGICSAIFEEVPYNWVIDFIPVAPLVIAPGVLVVSHASGITSVAELVARARTHPGTLTFGSAGFGQTIHLCGELFKAIAGIDIVHAPRIGSAVALEELADGRITLMFDNVLSALPYIRGGKLRALAITSAMRSPQLPEVPTMIESGIPDYDLSVWIGLLAPAGTPDSVRERLANATREVLALPEVHDRLEAMGAQRLSNSVRGFSWMIANEAQKWTRVVERTGLRSKRA